MQQEKSIWSVGGWLAGTWFFQEIIPLRGSILQVATCQILSLAENPRWSPVWQYVTTVQLFSCCPNMIWGLELSLSNFESAPGLVNIVPTFNFLWNISFFTTRAAIYCLNTKVECKCFMCFKSNKILIHKSTFNIETIHHQLFILKGKC